MSSLLLIPVAAIAQERKLEPLSSQLKQCWLTSFDAGQVRKMFASDALLFVATSDGKLRALNVHDGSPAWAVEVGGEFVSNIVTTDTDVIVVSNSAGENKQTAIRSVSQETGVVHWRAELPYSEKYYVGKTGASEFAAVASTGSVTGFSVTNGAIVWRSEVGRVTAEPSFARDALLVATEANAAYSIVRLRSGSANVIVASKWKPTAIEMLEEEAFLVGDERGNITLYSADGRKNWRFKNGASISHLTRTKRGLLAASNDNFLYMLTENRGGVIWKRRLSGRIALEPELTGDAIFALTYGDGRGYLLSLEKGKVQDQTASSDKEFSPSALAGLPNGRIAVPNLQGLAFSSLNQCP